MTDLVWSLFILQAMMGCVDSLAHHEFTEGLAWRTDQIRELKLHSLRNFLYTIIFAVFAWLEPRGLIAWAIMGLLGIELCITLLDFAEEDQTRKLPVSERMLHTLLTINFGALLGLITPLLIQLGSKTTAAAMDWKPLLTPLFSVFALGCAILGLHELKAALRLEKFVMKNPSDLVTTLPARQSVLIAGGTGFVGTRLANALVAANHQVTVHSRSQKKPNHLPDPVTMLTEFTDFDSEAPLNAVVNLTGAGIADRLWTEKRKRVLLDSRLDTTRNLVAWLAQRKQRPDVLISASAVGWYGMQGDRILVENSAPEDCFSHRLCEAWEAEANKAKDLGIRVVNLRIGVVLDRSGGMLKRMLPAFSFGLGAKLGSGEQWMSWIDRDDLVRLIAFCIANEDISGPVNATAPEPVTNSQFSETLAEVLNRPLLFRAPAPVLHLAGGEMARELLTHGQRVQPQRALAEGFEFTKPTLNQALQQQLNPSQSKSN